MCDKELKGERREIDRTVHLRSLIPKLIFWCIYFAAYGMSWYDTLFVTDRMEGTHI
jgi:hypothetical protein